MVVTPLVALMLDQVQSLRITSTSHGISRDLETDSSLFSDSLLFCTPESLISLSGGMLLYCASLSKPR